MLERDTIIRNIKIPYDITLKKYGIQIQTGFRFQQQQKKNDVCCSRHFSVTIDYSYNSIFFNKSSAIGKLCGN